MAASATPAAAQDAYAHETARKSSFCIKVSGQTKTGVPTNDILGTGFLVETDGSILTSYHLLRELEAQDPDTEKGIDFWLSLGNCNFAQNLRAQIVDSKPSLDVLLLRIEGDLPDAMPPPLKLGSIEEFKKLKTNDVLSGGFPQDNPRAWRYRKYAIESRAGPGGYTWMLDKSVEGGRSGSAVYYEVGPGDIRVVGIMKGETKKDKIGLFVPIGYADTLLLPLRLSDLNNRLANMAGKPSDDAISAYLASSQGDKALDGWLQKNLQGKLDKEIDDFMERNEVRLDSLISRYMKNVVAYSSGAEFVLSLEANGRKYFTLPFYKTGADEGFLKCNASYSNEDIKNDILIRVNDRDEIRYKREFDDPKLEIKRYFVKDNRKLYDGYDDSVGTRPTKEPDSSQKIRFWIDDKTGGKGYVTLLCTILIVGPAKHVAD